MKILLALFFICVGAESNAFSKAFPVKGRSMRSPGLVIECFSGFGLDPAGREKGMDFNMLNESDSLYFTAGSAWKYWDNSTDPGALWNTAGYDDSGWTVGTGHMGFGDGDEVTVLNPGNARYCFRKTVFVEDADNLDEVYFHVVHDDGAVIYINGQEFFRTETMPLTVIGHDTTARQRINTDTENSFYTYKADPSFFFSGENLIAISVHNVTPEDEDLSFDCFITPTFDYSQDGPYVFYVGDSVRVIEVTPSGLVSATYPSLSGIELTSHIPQLGKSFSFFLKPELTIEPAVYPKTPSKFFAISDFDSHIEGFTLALLKAEVMDDDFNWIYGDGHLIINGDVFDRGENTTECLWLIYKLESEAEAQGGKVHFTMGNHEMFNMMDDWRYVEVKYLTNAQLMGKRMLELYSASTEIGRWLRTKNLIEKLGDYLIVHAGISPAVAALNATYEQMNDYGRKRMNSESCTGPCDTVTGTDGLYWYRGMAQETLSQTQIEDILYAYDAQRIIIGHTKDSTIRSLYQDRVVAIDIYHGENYDNGYMEALHFEKGCFHRFIATGTTGTYIQLGDCDEYSARINEDAMPGFLLFPNPSPGYLNVVLPEALSGEYKYTIINTWGRVVQRGLLRQDMIIDVSRLSPGLFVLLIEKDRQFLKRNFILK